MSSDDKLHREKTQLLEKNVNQLTDLFMEANSEKKTNILNLEAAEKRLAQKEERIKQLEQ